MLSISYVMYVFTFWSCILFFFFKQKTAYEMRISDWSSDVCSSDLQRHASIHRSPPRPRPLKMMSILATCTRICHGSKLESKRRKQNEHLTRRKASRFQ